MNDFPKFVEFREEGPREGFQIEKKIYPIEERIVWEYGTPGEDRFYTASKGAAQPLPNGNVLIAHSALGRGFEITRDGTIVWDYHSPFTDKKGERSTIVRMKRYDRALIEGLLEKR